MTLITSGCHTDPPFPEDRFTQMEFRDTLSFLASDHFGESRSEIMPNEFFFKSAPPEMCAEIQDFVDNIDSRVLPRKKFALNGRYDAWQVEIRYYWFVQESLWIYDNREKRFSDRITVAEWYGGDGGQMRTAAWLWRQRDTIQLIQRAWERNIRLEGDEVATHYQEFVTLWEFQDGKFKTVPVQDSVYWMEQFPLERME